MLKTPDRSTKVLLALADYMEKVDPRLYDQRVYNACCGRGCIAWHATEMLGIVVSFGDVGSRLGLPRHLANSLFHSDAGQKNVMGMIVTGPTPQDAAKAIRHVAVTGDVPDWWTKFISDKEVLRDAGDSGDVLHELEPVDVS